jgi:hypothetical protein
MNVQVEQMRAGSETQTRTTAADLGSEVSDLATGAGILLFVLAPFALPALALMAVAALALSVPLLVGAVLAAPILLMRRRWRPRRTQDRIIIIIITTGWRRDDHNSPQRIGRERHDKG